MTKMATTWTSSNSYLMIKDSGVSSAEELLVKFRRLYDADDPIIVAFSLADPYITEEQVAPQPLNTVDGVTRITTTSNAPSNRMVIRYLPPES